MDLEKTIEGVLFYKAEPVSKAELSRFLSVSEEEVKSAVSKLSETLSNRGIALVETETEVQLMTTASLGDIIEALRKDELRRDIGKAGAETLSIVFYRGPVTRAEIDFIRGVNSTFILRNLLMRGLIERIQHPTDKRAFLYQVTPALFAHLGIAKKEELQSYSDVMETLEHHEREYREENEEADVQT